MNPTVTTDKIVHSPSWEVNRDLFSGDELIEAYLQGCKEGVDQFKKVLLKKLSENLFQAQQLGNAFIHRLNKDGEICIGAHLKYMDIERYKIIFVINADIYYSFELMDPLYELAFSFEAENNSNDFSIEIAFMPQSEHLNNDRLVSDGFIFEYNG
jgi:hypothetical protein